MDIDVYDMLVFTDSQGSIIQDCVCSIYEAKSGLNLGYDTLINCNSVVMFCSDKKVVKIGRIDRGLILDDGLMLSEIWKRTGTDKFSLQYKL